MASEKAEVAGQAISHIIAAATVPLIIMDSSFQFWEKTAK
jgi:hypothetical protein